MSKPMSDTMWSVLEDAAKYRDWLTTLAIGRGTWIKRAGDRYVRTVYPPTAAALCRRGLIAPSHFDKAFGVYYIRWVVTHRGHAELKARAKR